MSPGGAIAPAGLAMHTLPANLRLHFDRMGDVQVRLAHEAAPLACQVLCRIALSNGLGKVHRAEPIPTSGDGPPYALVQGTVSDASGELPRLPHEGGLPIGRGAVVLIVGSADIFVALAPHPGWEVSMTVFGHVEEDTMRVMDSLAALSVHTITHPVHGTVMSMLDQPVPFGLSVVGEASEPVPLTSKPASAEPFGIPVEVDMILDNLLDGSNGSARLIVHPEWAPLGAARFLELVDEGFFNGQRFFRAVPGFVAQWGLHPDPQENARWRGIATPIQDDTRRMPNTKGRVVFAAAGPNSRTSQCFINLVDSPHLDAPAYSFAPFAEVIEGMENVLRIYTGYGETVDQSKIHTEGDAYLVAQYPKLSRIVAMRRHSRDIVAPEEPSNREEQQAQLRTSGVLDVSPAFLGELSFYVLALAMLARVYVCRARSRGATAAGKVV